MEKGRFSKTDHYIDHAIVNKDGKSVLLVTNCRLLLVSRHDLFGQWQVGCRIVCSVTRRNECLSLDLTFPFSAAFLPSSFHRASFARAHPFSFLRQPQLLPVFFLF